MDKKIKRSGVSTAILGFMAFSAVVMAEPGIYDRPTILASDNDSLKKKYRRVVLFGDSQLDVNNSAKKLNYRIWSNFNGEYELPLGAPFTSGKGNAAQQLFGDNFLAANPLYYKGVFTVGSVDIAAEFAGSSYNESLDLTDNQKNVNMAQGGSKILDVYPGKDRSFLYAMAANQNIWVRAFANSFIKSIDPNINIDFLKPIIEQPRIFKALGGRFNENDLALVMAGGNDVIAQGYDKSIEINEAKKTIGEGREKIINDIAEQGAKNIFLGNIPDVRFVPDVINWKPGEVNALHLGVARQVGAARQRMIELVLSLNEQTTSSALTVTKKNPGTTITLFDAFKFMQHVANDRKRYGIINDIGVSCASIPECNKSRGAEGGKYLTEDGLHPSEKTSEIIANAYKYYLRDARQPLIRRLSEESSSYDAYFDAFADIVVTQEASELVHNIVGGVLDLSLKSQVDSLTNKVALNGAILRFDDVTEKNKESQYSHQLDADLIIKERLAGIEVPNASSELLYSGNATGFALLKSGSGTLTLTGNNRFGAPDSVGMGISAGVLQVGNGGDSGSLDSDVVVIKNSSLAFNHNVDHRFAGNVVGSGAL
ncbi:SGNH/GDSL hydrolase family protein, partial [Pseudomonas aeruginosa]